jgi:hexosaminidase
MKKAFWLFLLTPFFALSQPTIIPEPTEVIQKIGPLPFVITPTTEIVLLGSGLDNTANFFNDYLQKFYGFKLAVKKSESVARYSISLNFEKIEHEHPGAYHMIVDQNQISIGGDNEQGVFYGLQTLIQLLPVQKSQSLSIPALEINDKPRFGYRGLHFDVARHFTSLDFIKKYIDFIALHKLNYFHWHLTDDQGWRIEIKKHPGLTSKGGWRNGTIIGRYPGKGNDNIRYGGFYTQAEVKEIVAYAAARYITVVPEIEMPGHASAAIAAYPWLSCFPDQKTHIPANMISNASKQANGKLVQETWGVFDDVFCAGKEETFKFLEEVVDEVIPLFPSKYFHVGGDECPKTHWKKCPNCQKRMKDNNLKDEHELQSYFIQRMEKYVNAKGKTLIGWDEILEGGLAPNAIVMSWRGEKGGIEAAKQKHQVIMTPGNPVYFDHTQSQNEDSVTIGGYNPIEKVYAYEPVPKELSADEAKYVLGAQANLWTEYIKNTRKVEYMLMPRLAALSEVLWSPKEKRNWKWFEKKLQTQFKRYDLWKVNYSKAYFDLRTSIRKHDERRDMVSWHLAPMQKNTTIKITDPANRTNTFPPKVDSFNYFIYKSGTYTAQQYLAGKKLGNPVSISLSFNKATGKNISLATEPATNYPGDGAFTLVNGIQNNKGLNRSREFLGFLGPDCDATIDLGKMETVSSVVVHTLRQHGSWIYQPKSVEVFGSVDGESFVSLGTTAEFIEVPGGNNGLMKINMKPAKSRFIRVHVSNAGIIAQGNPGAGTPAWLFVDEIEIN